MNFYSAGHEQSDNLAKSLQILKTLACSSGWKIISCEIMLHLKLEEIETKLKYNEKQ